MKDRLIDHWHIEIPCFRRKSHCILRAAAQDHTRQSQLDRLVKALAVARSLQAN